jgi:micrococcal nuclease
MMIIAGLFACAAALGFVTAGSQSAGAASPATYSDTATNCRVVDGDTLHCDGGRVRLLGIDAPELPGHCAQGRDCAPGDPYESTRSLEAGMGDGSSLRIESVGTDRYGRTLALVKGSGGDLSCWQLRHGEAIYKPRWDNDGRVEAICPSAAR